MKIKEFLESWFDRKWTAITDQIVIMFLGLVVSANFEGFTGYIGSLAFIFALFYLIDLLIAKWHERKAVKANEEPKRL